MILYKISIHFNKYSAVTENRSVRIIRTLNNGHIQIYMYNNKYSAVTEHRSVRIIRTLNNGHIQIYMYNICTHKNCDI